MGTRKHSTLFALLTILAITAAVDINDQSAETRLPVVKPEINKDDRSSVNEKDLLSTLQELYQSLIGQIAVLETKLKSSTTDTDSAEISHLVQHYTAQKNNIEREISLLQSIESATAPRHILTHISPEEKIVPSLLNIFKKPKPSNDMSSEFAYSFPYPPYYYPGYGPQIPQIPYPYQAGPSPKPDYMYMNSLVQSTFPGHEPGPNHNHQTFTLRNQFPSPEASATNLQVQTKFTPPPQVTLQGEIPRTQVEPQRISNAYPTQPQVQSTFKPQPVEAQSPLNPMNQQPGQGVFIYYPNAVITEDEDQERPSIVDRVGQAFDRFGQAITNLATRQTLRSTTNDGILVHKHETAPTRIRVVQTRPRSSSNQKMPTARMLADKKPKLRWISV